MLDMLDMLTDELNVSATRSRTYKYIKRYKSLLKFKPIRNAQKVTQNLSFIAPSTNKDLNAVEMAASKNIRQEQLLKERDKMIECMKEAMDSLTENERYIIESLLGDTKLPDIDIYTDLMISKTDYYKLKRQTILKLAVYLGIEVYSD